MRGIHPYPPDSGNRENFGSKASGLLFLQENHFTVPPFFLLDFETVTALIDQKIETSQLVDKWIASYNIDANALWAVRSSAAIEDGQEQSFAGLFSTQINVASSGMASAISEVIKGYQRVKTLDYHRDDDFAFAIIVQQMLFPDYAGVVFSHHPLRPTEATCHINVVPGLGETLVSGRAEAFMIEHDGQHFSFLNEADDFSGEQFVDGEIRNVQQSGSIMKNALLPHLPALYRGAQELFRLKGFPVDMEFAIVSKELFWLQVRPITSRETEALMSIWDNANIGENFPGLTLPLSISYTRRTYTKGYTAMSGFLGMNEKQVGENAALFDNMVGGIYGAMYYNVTAWQQLLYQLPFGKKTSHWITQIWNTEAAVFAPPAHRSSLRSFIRLMGNLFRSFIFFGRYKKQFEQTYSQVLTAFDFEQLSSKSHQDLIDGYLELERKLVDKWIAPLLNGFFAMVLFTSLKKIFRRSRLFESHPNFINDILYSQGDVVSVQIVKDFQELVQYIQRDENLKQVFQQNSKETLLDLLPSQYPRFWKTMSDYIDRFGERAAEGELKLETQNYKDDPTLLIAFLQSNVGVKFDRQKEMYNFDYQQVIKDSYAFRPIKRMVLQQLIKVTIPRIKDRENYRFLRTKSYHIVRQIFRAMGKVVYQQGYTESETDFLYLEYKELTNPELAPEYKKRIEARKKDYHDYQKIKHASRYEQRISGFTAVEKSAAAFAKDRLQGTGCCSGTITAEVVIVTGAAMEDKDLRGKIFIAHHFEPGWINLFAQASGVISERGNLLSHTAILCREMGIPSIVGVKDLMAVLQEGDVVQMNGATGEVNVLN